jgi:hypothetical protein
MSTNTRAIPFPTRTADPRCLHCYAVIFRASDGHWHHGSTGSRTCAPNDRTVTR